MFRRRSCGKPIESLLWLTWKGWKPKFQHFQANFAIFKPDFGVFDPGFGSGQSHPHHLFIFMWQMLLRYP
jgi:hypothetical protein